MKTHFAAITLLALCACGGSETTNQNFIVVPPGVPSVPENDAFAPRLNGVRAANGAADVAYNSQLGVAAQTHADDMLVNDYFSHTGWNGSTFDERATAAGYNWSAIGENIAQGQQTQEQVMESWTNSQLHHENNINPVFEDFGLGIAGTGSNKRWVLMLGAQ
jgi:uncharacterized protein YkwD